MNKTEITIESMLDSISDQINPFVEFIYENEVTFLKYFVPLEYTIGLIGVWFSENTIKYQFVLDSGQHIVHEIKYQEFIEWINSLIP